MIYYNVETSKVPLLQSNPGKPPSGYVRVAKIMSIITAMWAAFPKAHITLMYLPANYREKLIYDIFRKSLQFLNIRRCLLAYVWDLGLYL